MRIKKSTTFLVEKLRRREEQTNGTNQHLEKENKELKERIGELGKEKKFGEQRGTLLFICSRGLEKENRKIGKENRGLTNYLKENLEMETIGMCSRQSTKKIFVFIH